MKTNTILLLAILGLAVWYLFIRKAPAIEIQQNEKGEKVIITPPAPPATTIIEKIVEVIKYRDRPIVPSRIKNTAAAGTTIQSDFTPTAHFWKNRR